MFLFNRSEPRENRLFADVEKFVDLEKALFNERRDASFNITSVLVDCHANHTLYKVLTNYNSAQTSQNRLSNPGQA